MISKTEKTEKSRFQKLKKSQIACFKRACIEFERAFFLFWIYQLYLELETAYEDETLALGLTQLISGSERFFGKL